MNLKKALSISIFILTVALSISILLFQEYFKGNNLGLLGVFLANFAGGLTVFVPAPAFLTVFSAGSVYPPFFVGIVAALGATLGDMVFFYVAYAGRKLAIKKLEKKYWFKFSETYFKRFGGWLLFVFAFIPNPLFDSLGLIAGVFAFSPVRFFVIVTLGRFFRYFILAGIGAKF